jgi:predicted TPR repeat methyltransferase
MDVPATLKLQNNARPESLLRRYAPRPFGTTVTALRVCCKFFRRLRIAVRHTSREQASREQIYSKLTCNEIVAWLERSAAESLTFDIVLSPDVFIYVGNLEPAFKATRRILADKGLFVFSVERLAQGSFELLPTGRYSHSTSYLRELASRHGFAIELSEQVNLRKERDVTIEGSIFVLTRP